MSDLNINTQGQGLDLFMNLQPPGSQGDNYNNLVVNLKGVPIGENPAGKSIAIHLGYSETDTIGPALDEVLALAANLNISLYVSGTDAVKVYINTLDPSQPNVPPIRALINIADKDLQDGKVGGFAINVQMEETSVTGQVKKQENVKQQGDVDEGGESTTKSGYGLQNIEDTVNEGLDNAGKINDETDEYIKAGRENNNRPFTDIEMTIGKTSGGNLWFGGNVYVAFLETFMELQRILMQNKVVQGDIELAGMHLTVTLAQSTADMIMAIAKVNQMIHIVTAVMSAVSIAVSVGGLYMTLRGTQSGIASARDPSLPARHVGWVEMGGTIGQMGPQMEKMTTAAVQAATDLMIAEKEGLKEILQAYRTLAQHQMDKAAEAFKASEDQLMQALQSLDKIRENLMQAIAAALRK